MQPDSLDGHTAPPIQPIYHCVGRVALAGIDADSVLFQGRAVSRSVYFMMTKITTSTCSKMYLLKVSHTRTTLPSSGVKFRLGEITTT